MTKRAKKLSCLQVKHSIRAYLQGELSLSEAADFAAHVRECKVCREELEEYYAFSSVLMQLEAAEEAEKGDFFMNVEKRLERTEAQVNKEKKSHLKRRIVYALLALAIAAAMGVSFGA